MLKVSNEDTRTMSLASSIFIINFEHISQHSRVLVADFEQVNVYWLVGFITEYAFKQNPDISDGNFFFSKTTCWFLD